MYGHPHLVGYWASLHAMKRAQRRARARAILYALPWVAALGALVWWVWP